MAQSKGTLRLMWENIFPYEVRCGIEEVPREPGSRWQRLSKKQKRVSNEISPQIRGSVSKQSSPFVYHS